jgi:hypothetical protein
MKDKLDETPFLTDQKFGNPGSVDLSECLAQNTLV